MFFCCGSECYQASTISTQQLFHGIPVFEEPQLHSGFTICLLRLPVAESRIPLDPFVCRGGIHTHYDSCNLQLLSKLSTPAYRGPL